MCQALGTLATFTPEPEPPPPEDGGAAGAAERARANAERLEVARRNLAEFMRQHPSAETANPTLSMAVLQLDEAARRLRAEADGKAPDREPAG